MKFKLKSNFSPTGDQPQAINSLTKWIKEGNAHQTLLGVTGSGKTFTLANVINKVNMPTLVISHNKTLAAQLYQEFRDFFPENAVCFFVSYYDYYQPEAYVPTTDTYIEKETEINDEIDKLRLSATAQLLTRPDVIVVASVSCIYNLGSPDEYGKHFLELMPGMHVDRTNIVSALVDIQYQKSDFDFKRGSFRLKGDTLTVWPADLSHALRLTFLDKLIQNINPIDPITGNLLELTPEGTNPFLKETNHYVIYPAKHYQTNTANREQIFKNIKADLAQRLKELKSAGKITEAYRLGQRVKYDLEMIQELGYVNGIENYSRYFDGRSPGDPPYTLLDFFRFNAQKFKLPGFLTIIDESHMSLPQLNGMYSGDRSRKQTLIDFGFRLPSALDNRPLKYSEITARLPQTIYVSATPATTELELSSAHIAEQLIRPTGLLDPEIEIRPTQGQISDLVIEIMRRYKDKQRVLVTTLTKRTAEALSEYLNDKTKLRKLLPKEKQNLSLPRTQYLHADVKTLDRADILDSLRLGDIDVVIGINLLREGLDLPEVSLVAILDADKEGFLRSKTSLIQTMGRAARHRDGKVILYADHTTQSMHAAIEEVSRRRNIQQKYNQANSLTPTTIVKPIREKLLDRNVESVESNQAIQNVDLDSLTPQDKLKLQTQLKRLMNEAAKNWDFEQATVYRDLLHKIA